MHKATPDHRSRVTRIQNMEPRSRIVVAEIASCHHRCYNSRYALRLQVHTFRKEICSRKPCHYVCTGRMTPCTCVMISRRGHSDIEATLIGLKHEIAVGRVSLSGLWWHKVRMDREAEVGGSKRQSLMGESITTTGIRLVVDRSSRAGVCTVVRGWRYGRTTDVHWMVILPRGGIERAALRFIHNRNTLFIFRGMVGVSVAMNGDQRLFICGYRSVHGCSRCRQIVGKRYTGVFLIDW